MGRWYVLNNVVALFKVEKSISYVTQGKALCVLYPIKYLHSLDYKHAQIEAREAEQIRIYQYILIFVKFTIGDGFG